MSEQLELVTVSHPLVGDRLTALRDATTPPAQFRQALDELAFMLLYEATRDYKTEQVPVVTPIMETTAPRVNTSPLLVPVLRAGLGMAQAGYRLFPSAQMGFVGLARDEATHRPASYLESLPADIGDRPAFVLDPMLATGGSAAHCLDALIERGARSITLVCVLASPEGVQFLQDKQYGIRLVTAAVDEKLNDSAYIVPGLGDAGDRQFGPL